MIVKAVAPYQHPNFLNFKNAPYEAWLKCGGQIADAHYPARIFHGFTFRWELPTLWKNKKAARIRFVSGYSIRFDSFPDYACYEVIPVIWDCWPSLVDGVASFFTKHHIRTAFFTSSQTADIFRCRFPDMNIFHITEGVDIQLYSKGKSLAERKIDILEVGRKNGHFFNTPLPRGIKHIKTGNFNRFFKTDQEFRLALADTRVTINVPRCDVDLKAGNVETLTQRYWECMLSRVVMIGRSPKELTDLIDYNPVVEWDGKDATPLVVDILENIDKYQNIVDKNYEIALEKASWDIRIKQIMSFLTEKGYII